MQAPGQVQRTSQEGSEGSGFGAEPGQVQQGSGAQGQWVLEKVAEKIRERFWELVQGQEKVAEKKCKNTLQLLGIPPKLFLDI